jgi:hypothetical protein
MQNLILHVGSNFILGGMLGFGLCGIIKKKFVFPKRKYGPLFLFDNDRAIYLSIGFIFLSGVFSTSQFVMIFENIGLNIQSIIATIFYILGAYIGYLIQSMLIQNN